MSSKLFSKIGTDAKNAAKGAASGVSNSAKQHADKLLNPEHKSQDHYHFFILILIGSLIVSCVLFCAGWVISLIDGGCKFRYAVDTEGKLNNKDYISTQNIVLAGNGADKIFAPSGVVPESGENVDIPVPLKYFQWLNTGQYIDEVTGGSEKSYSPAEIDFTIGGEISLARVSLHQNNIEGNFEEKKIKIPQVGSSEVLSLIFKASQKTKILLKLNSGDSFLVKIHRERKPTEELEYIPYMHVSPISGNIEMMCNKINNNFDSVCGRYYTDIFSENLIRGENIFSPDNKPNEDNKIDIRLKYEFVTPGFLWGVFTDNESGTVIPGVSADKVIPVSFLKDDPTEEEPGLLINNMNEGHNGDLKIYFDTEGSGDLGGGYIFDIQQTAFKVNPKSGLEMWGNGMIEYVISDDDPNELPEEELKPTLMQVEDGEEGQFAYKLVPDNKGFVWIRVKVGEPFKSSPEEIVGEYNISWTGLVKGKDFLENFVGPIIDFIPNTVNVKIVDFFKKMTCYVEPNDDPTSVDRERCTNFFLIIRAVLALYIIIYGFMFLTGVVTISNLDLVVRIIKITLVAGIINGGTFVFFNDYIFPLVQNFTNEIILLVLGSDLPAEGQSSSVAIFQFVAECLNKLIGGLFWKQLIAVIGTGYLGIFMATLVLAYTICAVVASFEAITLYLYSLIMLLALISLGPIFLLFCLFEKTSEFFFNWIKRIMFFLFYPILYILGLSILMDIFTVFLDQVIGYSLCVKCAFPITLGMVLTLTYPIPAIGWVSSIIMALAGDTLNSMVLICLPYYKAWGVHHTDSNLLLEISGIVTIMIIGTIIREYDEFIQILTSSLFTNESVDFKRSFLYKALDVSRVPLRYSVSAAKVTAKVTAKAVAWATRRVKRNAGYESSAVKHNYSEKKLDTSDKNQIH